MTARKRSAPEDVAGPQRAQCPWCLGPIYGNGEAAVLELPTDLELCEDEHLLNGEAGRSVFCDRPKGHDGQHVQCGFHFHNVNRWDDADR